MQVMVLSASAGIMEGDVQKFDIHVNPGTSLEYLSQAYEKIHKMKEGMARRRNKDCCRAGGIPEICTASDNSI